MNEYMIQIGDEVREMTSAEIAALEQARADNAKIDEAHELLVAAKTSACVKLKALGLTDDEINALLGA